MDTSSVATWVGKQHMFKGRAGGGAAGGSGGGFKVPRAAAPSPPPDASEDDVSPDAAADQGPFRTARSMAGPAYADKPGKTLGGKRRFQPPAAEGTSSSGGTRKSAKASAGASPSGEEETYWWMPEDGELPEALKGIEPAMIDRIMNEVMDNGDPIAFDDIAGLGRVKQSVIEIVVWPILNPALFSGLRALPRGLLLFGPPGTGKTLIGKAVASQSGATFFSVSASSLTSKWIGEGERMVRTMFAAARWKQPAVIFIDEIDSLLTARGEGEHEASRRIKTEFLVQMDGAGTKADDQVLVIGATNRPGELDEAARRRFVKRLYVPLPDDEGRAALIQRLLSRADSKHALAPAEVQEVVRRTKGYSGADLTQLCQAAAWAPLRELAAHVSDIKAVSADSIRSITLKDFKKALRIQGPSVDPSEVERYESFDAKFGVSAQAAAMDSDTSGDEG